jgi:ribosome-associated protein
VNAGGRVREDGGVNAREVPIREDSIRLGQLLKLADLVEAGAEVKPLMVQGLVSVNGEVETRRGRQLVKGDVVTLGDESVLVT